MSQVRHFIHFRVCPALLVCLPCRLSRARQRIDSCWRLLPLCNPDSATSFFFFFLRVSRAAAGWAKATRLCVPDPDDEVRRGFVGPREQYGGVPKAC